MAPYWTTSPHRAPPSAGRPQLTGPEQVTVEMDEDGTNDEVHLEICSDVNDACCDTAMDSIANDFKSWSIRLSNMVTKPR